MAERTGWTINQILDLTPQQLEAIISVWTGDQDKNKGTEQNVALFNKVISGEL